MPYGYSGQAHAAHFLQQGATMSVEYVECRHQLVTDSVDSKVAHTRRAGAEQPLPDLQHHTPPRPAQAPRLFRPNRVAEPRRRGLSVAFPLGVHG